MNKILFFLPALFFASSCSPPAMMKEQAEEYTYNSEAEGPQLEVVFEKGPAHNHPLMAFWLEDTAGNFIKTLYVAESIGKGVFDHGDPSEGKWKPGEIRRPAALPVWSHKRGIKAPDGLYVPSASDPVPDAITGPTPPGDFIMRFSIGKDVPQVFNIFMEINQSWDWNEYWTNNLYPDNEDYKTSCQPALVYKATIDQDDLQKEIPMQVIGHSHYSGDDGEIYEDLSTVSTALDIVGSVKVGGRR